MNENEKNSFVAGLQQQLLNLLEDGNLYMQQDRMTDISNSPTLTKHDDYEAAFKWMCQPLRMILVSE